MVQESDPNGISQHTPGAKLDADKPDASLLLLFGNALREVAAVGTFGAKKYSRGGWQSVPDGRNRYTAALLRHLLQENDGPIDSESGLQHDAQVAWNALARLELRIREEMKYEHERHTKELSQATDFTMQIPQSPVFTYGPGVGSSVGDYLRAGTSAVYDVVVGSRNK